MVYGKILLVDSTYGLQGQLIGNLSQFIEDNFIYGNNNYLANIVRLKWGQYLYSLMKTSLFMMKILNKLYGI